MAMARAPIAVKLPPMRNNLHGAFCLVLSAACAGGGSQATPDGGGSSVGASDGSTGGSDGAAPGGDAASAVTPSLASCQILPANNIFNTAIDNLPVDPQSAAYLTTIGVHTVHLDLGTTTDQASPDYYGVPFNVVHGDALSWTPIAFHSADPSLSWDPTGESDCADAASGAAHTLVAPCTAANAPKPAFPMPASPLIESGIDRDPTQPYNDHHTLVVDVDHCRLWESYHTYPTATGWDVFAVATFDLTSNALRPDGWTSADAAGFPILPLLLRADEAGAGAIHHALRFTIHSDKIRTAYTWPARHLTTNGTSSTNLPPMGQAFRLKASYVVPADATPRTKAILQALKTYGMYLADGGSSMYVTGEPSAAWDALTFAQVQAVTTSDFEAVDLRPIMARPGFDPSSGAVPTP
jgi:hypothetical protein